MTTLWTAEVRHAEIARQAARQAELRRQPRSDNPSPAAQLASFLRLAADLIDIEPAPRSARRLANG